MSETENENEAAPVPTGVGVAVYQGLPDVKMVVNEGNVVSPAGDDQAYEGGQEIVVDGPAAIALAAAGHATVVGPVDAPATNGAAAAEAPVEPPAEEAPAE